MNNAHLIVIYSVHLKHLRMYYGFLIFFFFWLFETLQDKIEKKSEAHNIQDYGKFANFVH